MPAFNYAQNRHIDNQVGFLRLCLRELTERGVIAQRIQIKDDSILVQIDRPLACTETTQHNDYHQVDLYGCRVVWKEHTDETSK